MDKPENNQPDPNQEEKPDQPARPAGSSPDPLGIGLNKILTARQAPAIIDHQNWLDRLTPEEQKIYDEIGFRFQLLRSLLANAHLIAMPVRPGQPPNINAGAAGQKTPSNPPSAPFSWEEFMKMMDEIREEAENFIGREIERPKSHLFKNFTAFYHLLCSLANTPPGNQDDLNSAFLGTLGLMPQIKDFVTLSRQLNLNGEEEAILKDVLKKLKQLYLAAKNSKSNSAGGITPEDIGEVTLCLEKLECFRRVGAAGQKGPLDEFKNLINYINIWKKSFKDISGIVNDKTGDVFRTMAGTISQSFPAAIMPVTYRHHRDVIGRRIQQYKKLTEILNNIDDPNLQDLAKKIVFQISIILSYLDFLWNMHNSINEHGSQRIIYPKNMLMIAPLISNETGKLIKNLQSIAASRKSASIPPSGADDDNDMLDIFEINEESQPEIVLSEFGPVPRLPSMRPGAEAFRAIVSEEINTLLFTSLPSEPKPQAEQINKNIGPALEAMVTYLSQQLREANKALQTTTVKSIKDTGTRSPHTPEIEYESLSPDIQTFLNSLQESLLLALVEIARIFEPDAAKNDIIPEFTDFENQAAELRMHLYNLGTVVESVGKSLDDTFAEKACNKPGNAAIKIKIGFMELMEAIDAFQKRQNSCMEQSKYHAALTGQDFEMVNGFITSISNYYLDGGIEQINSHIVAEYSNIRALDDLAKDCQISQSGEGQANNNSLNAWLAGWSELKRVENELDRTRLNNQDTSALEEKFKKLFLSLIEQAGKIASNPGENDPTGIFSRFIKNNPSGFTHNYRFDPGLYKFTSLMKQFSDFRSIFGMKSQIGNAPLLAEHDKRIKNSIHNTLELILSTVAYNGFSQNDQDKILELIVACRRDAGHLRFIISELVEELNQTLKYLESCIRFGQKHDHKISRKDLEDLFVRFRGIQKQLLS